MLKQLIQDLKNRPLNLKISNLTQIESKIRKLKPFYLHKSRH